MATYAETKKMADLAFEMVELGLTIQECRDCLTRYEARHRLIAECLLPELMERAGLTTFSEDVEGLRFVLKDGRVVKERYDVPEYLRED